MLASTRPGKELRAASPEGPRCPESWRPHGLAKSSEPRHLEPHREHVHTPVWMHATDDDGSGDVSNVSFPVTLTFKGGGQFSPSLPNLRTSRNLVYSPQLSGLAVSADGGSQSPGPGLNPGPPALRRSALAQIICVQRRICLCTNFTWDDSSKSYCGLQRRRGV